MTGRDVLVIMLDLAFWVAVSLVWRNFGWPYAVGLFVIGKATWHWGLRGRAK